MHKARPTWRASTSVTRARAAVEREPSSVPARRALARALEESAVTKAQRGGFADIPADALAEMAEAVDLRREVSTETRTDDDLLGLLEAVSQLAALTHGAGDPTRALVLRREAVGLCRYVIGDEGSTPALQATLMVSLHHLATLLSDGPDGDLAGAAEALDEAISLARLRLAAAPDDTGRRRQLAGLLHDSAILRMRADDPDAALALRTEEVELRTAVAAAPGARDSDQDRLARATYDLALARSHQNPLDSIALTMQAGSQASRVPGPLKAGLGATGRLLGRVARRNEEVWRKAAQSQDERREDRMRRQQGRPPRTQD